MYCCTVRLYTYILAAALHAHTPHTQHTGGARHATQAESDALQAQSLFSGCVLLYNGCRSALAAAAPQHYTMYAASARGEAITSSQDVRTTPHDQALQIHTPLPFKTECLAGRSHWLTTACVSHAVSTTPHLKISRCHDAAWPTERHSYCPEHRAAHLCSFRVTDTIKHNNTVAA